jgi:hypothetical protein
VRGFFRYCKSVKVAFSSSSSSSSSSNVSVLMKCGVVNMIGRASV